MSAIISVEDITDRHEHELAYMRMHQSTANNAAGNLMNIECDLTENKVEKISGFTHIADITAASYSISGLCQEIFKNNYSFVNESLAIEYFSREKFVSAYAEGKRHDCTEWQVKYPDGSEHWIDAELTLMEDPYNKHIKMFLWLRDITSVKKKQLEINYRSQHDLMTGLYNRSTTEEMIRAKIEKGKGLGIFIILDLDRLKQINDSYGHDEGDKAIMTISKILKSHFRSSDIIGRFGGDEFVIYMPGAAKNKDVISGTINELIRKLDALSVGENSEMGITCSIGCVVENKDSTYESLFKQADRALYHVKKNGRNNFAFYSPEMDSDDFVYHMDKLFSLDYAKRTESGEVRHLINTLCEIYHLVIAFNITENTYHLMQEVKNGIFTQRPTFGNMDTLIEVSMKRMPPGDDEIFSKAVSRQALIEADARGEKHVSVQFRSMDIDGTYRLAECNSIMYHNEKGDLCEFALIRWVM